MNIFKRIFSALRGPHVKVLEEVYSPLSGRIVVWQREEGRSLLVDGYIQSISYSSESIQHRYWGKILEHLREKVKVKVNSALLVGLAGGTVAHLLQDLSPGVKIDGIEIDPAVVDLAKKYFDLEKIPNLNVVVGDGFEAISDPPKFGLRFAPYDLAVVDAYLGRNYPLQFESDNFYRSLKSLLRPGGLVVFNRISDFDRMRFEEDLKKYFGEIESVEIKHPVFTGNVLFFVKNK